MRFEEVEKHPQKLVLQDGTIVDVYYLFKTEGGIALSLSQQDSLNSKEKAKLIEQSKNCSLDKLIQMENDTMIDEIIKANKAIKCELPIGKISTVHCVAKGWTGLRVWAIEDPKFEAYLPFDLVSHSKNFASSI